MINTSFPGRNRVRRQEVTDEMVRKGLASLGRDLKLDSDKGESVKRKAGESPRQRGQQVARP